jgi:hypothetical protein
MDRNLSIITETAHHMTTAPPAVYGQFGSSLGLAEQALTAALRRHLAERETKPETWYALQLLVLRGPTLTREAILRDLENSRALNADIARETVARLEADGMIRGGAKLELTDEGRALHRSLREYIAGPTIELLGQFELSDIEATVRTLQAITERVGPAGGDEPPR